MNTTIMGSEDAGSLRRKAEERLHRSGKRRDDRYQEEDLQLLLHELQLRQIELEMQSEEVRRSRAFVDEILTEHLDFYDSAPVGFVTLDSNWTIINANATACRLLGFKRFNLTGSCFEGFVTEETRDELCELLRVVLQPTGRGAANVRLVTGGGERLPVRIEAAMSVSGRECRLVLIDSPVQGQEDRRWMAAELERTAAELERARALVKHLQELVSQCAGGTCARKPGRISD
ncbi:PAS domain S-box protein [Geobacter sp. SVR]|uniref:PAS domain S-box protein n=1 Tax=Geobacter sp. SVR TaxID=2495594 RepID=UPI00143F0212|nr:PAS domain-containing protein [Geobacter sp. SVR]BCS52713.1 hypothetical protein GSVR_10210 [Geobacter sp. SVR]GCF86791.1 hypothetical protein GSbR_33910 [Geobacter sp. SVR]